MSRHHGRNARVYLQIASGGTAAENVPGVNTFTVNNSTDKADVTAFGDSNHQYVTGIPDATGTFSGFWDDTSQQTYAAAADGVGRKTYMYPDIVASPTKYAYGSILPDFSLSAGNSDAVTFSASWNASGTFQWS